MSRKTQAKAPDPTIARNRRARHDYAIEETFEAGLALTGWEVKSLREGRAQINEGYISIRKGEGWLLGSHINPLPNVSHLPTDPGSAEKTAFARKRNCSSSGCRRPTGLHPDPPVTVLETGSGKTAIGAGARQAQARPATNREDSRLGARPRTLVAPVHPARRETLKRRESTPAEVSRPVSANY